ncbi:Bacteroides conjugative transposon TraJ protein [Parapedobacter koreensis]|uniref:Bacteroides conjugative transposon TraJ protein n=2 Tax=Parapedobacter koreensis TaxID=332977 RepID=A0A1H7FBY3_9SPHI|nr:Bacteroides conjugative transposon TraJ protein [Parapedobacter koreensis]
MRPACALAPLFCFLAALALAPVPAFGQSAAEIRDLQSVLDTVYSDMLPLCSRLIGVGRGIAGFAALWYIASRVWRQIAAAEAIDFYPLLRPFAIGLAVLFYPVVLAVLNGTLKPISDVTLGMVNDSDRAIATLLKQKEEAVKNSSHWQMYVGESGKGDIEKWHKYTYPDDGTGGDETWWDKAIGNDIKFWMDKQSYAFRNNVKQWLSEILQVVFAAASLCINAIRTFFMLVLGILGPLVFAFSVFDGLQHTLTVWIGRYINVYLWLPVCNLFGSIIGKIQEKMLILDISEIGQEGDTMFSATDTAYLIYLIIGILGYFSVPSVANYIVHASGANSLMQRVNTLIVNPGDTISQKLTDGGDMAKDVFGDDARTMRNHMAGAGRSDYFTNDHQSGRIKGE